MRNSHGQAGHAILASVLGVLMATPFSATLGTRDVVAAESRRPIAIAPTEGASAGTRPIARLTTSASITCPTGEGTSGETVRVAGRWFAGGGVFGIGGTTTSLYRRIDGAWVPLKGTPNDRWANVCALPSGHALAYRIRTDATPAFGLYYLEIDGDRYTATPIITDTGVDGTLQFSSNGGVTGFSYGCTPDGRYVVVPEYFRDGSISAVGRYVFFSNNYGRPGSWSRVFDHWGVDPPHTLWDTTDPGLRHEHFHGAAWHAGSQRFVLPGGDGVWFYPDRGGRRLYTVDLTGTVRLLAPTESPWAWPNQHWQPIGFIDYGDPDWMLCFDDAELGNHLLNMRTGEVRAARPNFWTPNGYAFGWDGLRYDGVLYNFHHEELGGADIGFDFHGLQSIHASLSAHGPWVCLGQTGSEFFRMFGLAGVYHDDSGKAAIRVGAMTTWGFFGAPIEIRPVKIEAVPGREVRGRAEVLRNTNGDATAGWLETAAEWKAYENRLLISQVTMKRPDGTLGPVVRFTRNPANPHPSPAATSSGAGSASFGAYGDVVQLACWVKANQPTQCDLRGTNSLWQKQTGFRRFVVTTDWQLVVLPPVLRADREQTKPGFILSWDGKFCHLAHNGVYPELYIAQPFAVKNAVIGGVPAPGEDIASAIQETNAGVSRWAEGFWFEPQVHPRLLTGWTANLASMSSPVLLRRYFPKTETNHDNPRKYIEVGLVAGMLTTLAGPPVSTPPCSTITVATDNFFQDFMLPDPAHHMRGASISMNADPVGATPPMTTVLAITNPTTAVIAGNYGTGPGGWGQGLAAGSRVRVHHPRLYVKITDGVHTETFWTRLFEPNPGTSFGMVIQIGAGNRLRAWLQNGGMVPLEGPDAALESTHSYPDFANTEIVARSGGNRGRWFPGAIWTTGMQKPATDETAAARILAGPATVKPPPGDFDDDGDVDGADFGIFAACFNGTGNPPTCGPLPWSPAADIDGDADVDGADFGIFAACFNGTGNPPACPPAQDVPTADLDRDGDVDGADFGILSSCLSGTDNPVEAGCETADLDGDGDVDGTDYGIFSGCFNSSGKPPACQ